MQVDGVTTGLVARLNTIRREVHPSSLTPRLRLDDLNILDGAKTSQPVKSTVLAHGTILRQLLIQLLQHLDKTIEMGRAAILRPEAILITEFRHALVHLKQVFGYRLLTGEQIDHEYRE